MRCKEAHPGVEAIPREPLFKSFFAGGFECSTHRLRNGQRLDLVAATHHEEFASQDYQRLKKQSLRVAREGLRWHLVERTRGHYDFSTASSIVRAARATGTQVIWDLCHFGWPDHLDIFTPDFVTALADYGAAFAKWLAKETDEPGFFVPVNEISFFSWAAADEGCIFPFAAGRGFELKTQLARAAIRAMDAIWSVMSAAQFAHVDPIIHVVADLTHPEEKAEAEAYRLSQFQSWDMISGRLWPELGGHEKYLDVIGANFYPHNQWFYNLKGFRSIRPFTPILRRDPAYRPFREMLGELYERYHRPMFIAETGSEDRRRAGWLRYVCGETLAAIETGVPIHGLCLYPILNHPGWDDSRHCRNGLWDYPDADGHRQLYEPLARELKAWQKVFEHGEASGHEAAMEAATA
ncbi:MAG TPA: beta-glucosidase [Verrucomicrobiae bacterium]|jgi:beta-glucosidase/6-phospho-beta-glucosidase/beta-galactosidase|nr:beta-glucosidase [Verrucomicrobiae bacterium]